MKRGAVVDRDVDGGVAHPPGDVVAMRHANREEVVHGRGPRAFAHHAHAPAQPGAVARRVLPAYRVPGVETTQLDLEHGCLQGIEALVRSNHHVLALSTLPEVPQAPHALR